LRVLWEHREALRGRDVPDPLPRAAAQYAALITRLDGSGPSTPVNVVAAPAIKAIEFDWFRARLVAIRDLPPRYSARLPAPRSAY
jgi:hypothetical protein